MTIAAEIAARATAGDLADELAALRREMLFAKKSGDAEGAADAKSRLWLLFYEEMPLVHDEAMNAARERVPMPKEPILVACHVAAAGEIKYAPITTEVRYACDVLTPVRLDRFREARDAYLEEIVTPIVAEQRQRLVEVMNQ